jgi:hypothetical protein
MRSFAVIAIALLQVACASRALPPHDIVGRYVDDLSARDAPSWRGVVGHWTAEYRADGQLFIQQERGMWIHSRYRLDDDVLTVRDLEGTGSCTLFGVDAASGRYRVQYTGQGIRFETLHDECSPRRFGMTVHVWRRSG